MYDGRLEVLSSTNNGIYFYLHAHTITTVSFDHK